MARIQAVPEPIDLDLYNQDDFALTLTFSSLVFDNDGDQTRETLDISTWIFDAAWRPNRNDPRVVPWRFGARNNSMGQIVLEVTQDMFTSMKAISPSGVWDLQVTFGDGTQQTMLSGYVYTDMDVTA